MEASKNDSPGSRDEVQDAVAALTEVLVRVAGGDYQARIPRTHRGDPIDVLAFMVNAAAEEIDVLVGELRDERDQLARAQQQLIQTAKLAALGELAGGVAHELNQPLTAIRGVVDLVDMRGQPLSADEIEMISKAVDRMSAIVDSIRTFARESPIQRGRVEAFAPVAAALQLLSPQFKQDGIRLDVGHTDGLPCVRGDVVRLQQVFVNLLANARDAVNARGRSSKGIVSISVTREGQTVRYVIEDNGVGIPGEIRDRLFDPFVTTKEVGKGTGLGLSVSYGIIHDHEGDIVSETPADGGARFSVRIPIVPDEDGS